MKNWLVTLHVPTHPMGVWYYAVWANGAESAKKKALKDWNTDCSRYEVKSAEAMPITIIAMGQRLAKCQSELELNMVLNAFNYQLR